MKGGLEIMEATFNNIKAIKTFFEAEPNGRKVTMEEMKALSPAEREELGNMCREVLMAK
jgi:hypothetical protein